MIDKNWTPAQMDEVERKWADLTLPTGQNLSAAEAERFMNSYLRVREDWVDQFVNAINHQEWREYERDRAYRVAYFKSEGKSERARDLDAKNDDRVQISELVLIEAKTAVQRAKLKLESATLGHHAAKKILDKLSEDMFLRT